MRTGRADHGDHEPGARALAAMAEAAERSRRSAEAASDQPSSSHRTRRQPRARLILALGVAVAVAAVGVVVTTRHHGTPVASSAKVPAPRSSPSAGSHSPTVPAESSVSTVPATTAPPTTVPATTVPPATVPATTVPPATVSPTAVPPSASGGPELSSIEPSSGAAGQVLVVTGSNLVSPSGQITAQFGGENALIACPTSTSCLLQVPTPTGAATTAPVTVTTDGGTSNAVNFTYG